MHCDSPTVNGSPILICIIVQTHCAVHSAQDQKMRWLESSLPSCSVSSESGAAPGGEESLSHFHVYCR